MMVLRGLAAFLLVLLAGLFLLIGLQPTDTENVRHSLANQTEMHADMVRMGNFTEKYRRDNGRLPNEDELSSWMQGQKFNYVGFRGPIMSHGSGGILLKIVRTGEAFMLGEESALPNDGHTYRIAYWNNWTEEYAPETGANTFAESLDEYAPPLWERALAIMIALAFAALTWRILRGMPARKEDFV